MTTHNRVDCARINQEIIKLNYACPLPIVHACSSASYERHLEDALVSCEPLPLQFGAINLLRRSLDTAMQLFNPKYIVHVEGDTWILDERIIYGLIAELDRNPALMIAGSAWDEDLLAFQFLRRPSILMRGHMMVAGLIRRMGLAYKLACTDSLATQFFIVRAVPSVLEVFRSVRPIPKLDLEQAVYRAFMRRFSARNVFRLRMREPIHPFNRYVCEKLALSSQHWPARGTANDQREPTHPRYIAPTMDGKREMLLRFPSIRQGAYIQKLLSAETFDYYNPGAART